MNQAPGVALPLPRFAESVQNIFPILVQLMTEFTDRPVRVAAHMCVADPEGNIVDTKLVGRFADIGASEKELRRCREKIKALTYRSELPSLDGCVRATNGHTLAIAGNFTDEWSEAAAVAIFRACDRDLMPPSLVHDIVSAKNNLLVLGLLQSCKLQP